MIATWARPGNSVVGISVWLAERSSLGPQRFGCILTAEGAEDAEDIIPLQWAPTHE